MKLIMTQGNLKSVLGDRRESLSMLTGRIIRRLREISGTSQGDLARLATANLSYISSIESGKNNISIRKVLLLCNAHADSARSHGNHPDANGMLSAPGFPIITGFCCSFALSRQENDFPFFQFNLHHIPAMDAQRFEVFTRQLQSAVTVQNGQFIV